MLPLLLTPAKTLENHAINALIGARFVGKDPSPSSQLRALKYAIRWERGIKELNTIGGDQWLAWAAGSVWYSYCMLFVYPTYEKQSEEAPPALLVAQSAQMCARKGSLRRATLCYVAAANRLDKCGIVRLDILLLSFQSSQYYHALETFNNAFSPSGSRSFQCANKQVIITGILRSRR